MANPDPLPRRAALAAILIVTCFFFASAASATACSATDSLAAQAAVDSITSWSRLAQFHARFGRCDHGSIAEGNSEAVARLLVDQWTTLPELSALAEKDPRFLKFVLRHLDSTLDGTDLERIVGLAATQCPAGNKKLCASLGVAARRALM